MSYTDQKYADKFNFECVLDQLRGYIKSNRPQSFGMTWNLFIRLYKKMKEYGIKYSVMDLFEYAQKEHIERFGSEIVSTSYF